ncbi:MAG TPA: hypothetical protein VMM92_05455 [Thermoanaerobaculia bacterium]|nr:hypothetical protein [Thermoanaerobaculia bacterium]
MKRHFVFLLTLTVLGTFPLLAQQPPHAQPPHAQPPHAQPRANQGHPPPPPTARRVPHAQPEVEHLDGGRVNSQPHVNHDHWYGHERADDPRFHQARAFEHGRFGHVGPTYHYSVSRFDRASHRFWLGSSAFLVAPFDWSLAADWCWDCGENFVVYDDPDHPGWYLLYNLETGGYVHVQYGG